MELDLDKLLTLIVAGMESGKAIGPNGPGSPFVVVPEGYRLEDLEKTLTTPARIRATVKAQDVRSFIAYINRFKTAATMIFGSISDTGAFLAAVLDYHEPGVPSWGSHLITYDCPLSKEWRVWNGNNTSKLSQEEFAHFIEANQLDIVDPPGAQMLEISNTLEATSQIQFASAVRLSDGTKRLHWAEDTVTKAGQNGTLDVPKTLTLALAPFVNGQPYTLNAHLRHLVANGRCTFLYELIRPHKLIELAVNEVMARIENETQITPLLAKV